MWHTSNVNKSPKRIENENLLEKDWKYVPAKCVKFRFAVEAVAVLTNAVKASENALVVESLAVDIEERAFRQGMVAAG